MSKMFTNHLTFPYFKAEDTKSQKAETACPNYMYV